MSATPPDPEPESELSLRVQRIRALLGSDQLLDAVKQLMDLAREFGSRDHENEAIVIKGQHTEFERELRIKRRSRSDLRMDKKALVIDVLELADAIQTNPRGEV